MILRITDGFKLFENRENADWERNKIMGKDLKGKELGRGSITKGRWSIHGKSTGRRSSRLPMYDWKLKEVKAKLAVAVDEAKRSNLLPGVDGKSVTLSEWFEEWFVK